MEKITLEVKGMKCMSCVRNIVNGLTDIGAAEVVADHTQNRVEVSFDPVKLSIEEIKQEIAEIGFEVL